MASPKTTDVVVAPSIAGSTSGDATWPQRALVPMIWTSSLLLTAGSVVGFLGRFWWVFDLTNHFRVQLLAVTILAATLVGLLRQWRPFLLVLVCLSVDLSLLYPFYVGNRGVGLSGEPLRVLSLNVNARNRSGARVLSAIREGAPDIFFLLEYNDYWQQTLRALEVEYPHTCLLPRRGNFGMAVYSRLPLEATVAFALQQAEFPAIELHVEHAGQSWTLLGVHVMPPVSAEASELRKLQFAELAARVRQKRGPLAVMGDLNCTAWSPYFRQLLAASGLRDSQLGRGVQPTWPVQHPLLGVPIDHCLVSPDVEIGRRWLTGPVGSDHLGVFVELACEARTDTPQGP